MEDTEIIKLYFAREEAAIAETAAKYGAYLHTIAYNILHREEDTEEVMNDTYLGAWNAIPPTVPEVLKHYLSRITRNLSLKRLAWLGAERRSDEMTQMLSEIEECIADSRIDTERILNSSVIAETLNRFLGRLSPQESAIFVSRYYYAQSLKAVAEKYDLSERRVKYILKCLRDELRRRLAKEGIAV